MTRSSPASANAASNSALFEISFVLSSTRAVSLARRSAPASAIARTTRAARVRPPADVDRRVDRSVTAAVVPRV